MLARSMQLYTVVYSTWSMISFYVIVATHIRTLSLTHCTNRVDTNKVVLTSHLRITECPHVAPVPFASPTGEADKAKGEVTGCGVRSARPHLTPRLDECLHHTGVPGEGGEGRTMVVGRTKHSMRTVEPSFILFFLSSLPPPPYPTPTSLHTHKR